MNSNVMELVKMWLIAKLAETLERVSGRSPVDEELEIALYVLKKSLEDVVKMRNHSLKDLKFVLGREDSSTQNVGYD